jgi:outer membrane protein assembly factor BamB
VRTLTAALAAALLVLAACSSGGSNGEANRGQSPGTTAKAPGATPADAGSWPTYDHDAARTGVADDQVALGRPAKAWDSPKLDGDVYAQPLVAGGKVSAATESNSVYALDAATGAQSWRAALGQPVSGASLPCGNIDPSGITGTPVVDAATDTLYAVAFLAAGPHHELFALDLPSGAVRWHRTVDPPGLSARVEQLRGALTLVNGRVYVPYGGLFGDCGPYKGAVVSVAADGQGALSTYTVPTSREAGIWTPAGVVSDGAGGLYVSTGNSDSRSTFDYGNAVIRLTLDLRSSDYFAPPEWARLNAGDVDLGSVGPALVGRDRLFAAGKSGIAYLLDRAHLGGIGGSLAQLQTCGGAFGQPAVSGTTVFLPCADGVLALNTAGDRLAKVWTQRGRAGPPILAAGAVWFIDGNGRLRALDPTNGQERFSADVGGAVSRFVTPAAAGGRVYAPSGDKVTAFAVR